MHINALEDQLFTEWKQNRPGFVADGVVDSATYLISYPKLLFILKEVNDPDGGDWDLREYMRDGARSQTWDTITRWVEGIRRLPEDIPWKEIDTIDGPRRRAALKSIAAINLKKSPGGSTADAGSIYRTGNEDRAFLNRQFQLYDADIVICSGTNDPFHWLIDFSMRPEWEATMRGIAYHEFKPGKFIIAFSHPEARVPKCLLYYGLIDAIREILGPRWSRRARA